MSTRTAGVAIVGMAGRFPGARDLTEYWHNLHTSTESITPLTDEQLRAAGVPDELINHPDYIKATPRFHGIDLFDADFFGYTAREAQTMDPQHRLFLETAWHALEHAGYDPTRHQNTTGVFAGAGTNLYRAHIDSHPDVVEGMGSTQILVGNELGFLATRVSYKLDLKGPSLSLRTACSTSLVAVHTACRSLLDGECNMALSGGVYVDPEPDTGYLYLDGSFVSSDGHVRPFDANARGTVFGSGVGVVVLKRLEDALADHDTIHAVIKGSAINNDGAVKVGFTAPSVTGQAHAIRLALTKAGLEPTDIDYIEAHGTGTPLGDPIEVQALAQVFGTTTRCALGSVKGNIGHLDAASGIAGLLKTVLALTHQTLPATINNTNPVAAPFHIPTEPTPWPHNPHRTRRAGISAFGFGGTNAHIIIEEPPQQPTPPSTTRTTHTLILSARTPEALEQHTDQLATYLHTENPDLTATAHTLALGRQPFPHRRTVTGTTTQNIATALHTRDPATVHTACTTQENTPVIFLFSGQGSQHPGMAQDLYTQEPTFRTTVDLCAQILHPLLHTDIRDLIFTGDTTTLDQTQWAQPALFTIEYALAKLWQHWGITPTAMIGHSLGEWVAACLAEVFTLPDALTLITLRGKLMQHQTPGAMLNVIADRTTLQKALPPELDLAAHNTPRDCVISGPHHAIAAFTTTAHHNGWTTHPVNTTHAFHSALMNPAIEPLTTALANTPLHPPQIPFISNTTGTWITPQQTQNPHYWANHLRTCVEYNTGITTLTTTHPTATLLEIGPSNTLTTLTRRITTNTTLNALPHKRDPRTATQTTHNTLAKLWLTGTTPNWTNHHTNHHRIPLPTYPFQRTPHWLPKQEPLRTLRRQNSSADWFYAPSWQRTALPAGQSSVYDEHWLIFADNLGIGDAMSQRLRDGGATVTVVTTADEWSEPEPGQFTIHPTRSIDYERLSAALLARVPTRFVHCWSITAPGDDNEDSALRLGFESLIRLGQALSREVNAAPRDLWVFSNGLHNVNGTEQLSPLKAPLLGPCRVLPRELPGLRCRSIDLDFHTAPDAAQLGRLMKEVAARPETGVDTVAHRGIHRWSQHYLRRPLPEPEPQQSVVRTGGVYLITGGTGGLGLALADQLAASRARIVITARTPLPPEQEWDSWIANNHTGRTTDILRRLVRLRDRDTELLVVNADVSDQDAMAAAVRMAVLRWGAIDGVFHAAGVAGGGLIQLKDLRTAAEVMRPKVRGTMVLEAVLAEQDLDFVVLFSSNGANVGSAGQSDYCAANCFLDAFAQDRGRRNRVIAIDWGPWKDVGMTVTSPLPPSLERARRGDADLRGMSVREGLYALDTILSFATESQIIVSPVDPAELIAEAFTVHTDGPESPQTDLTGMSVVHHAVGDIERAICAVWQELLGVNHVGSQDSFFDLGGNSLIAIQLVHGINRRLGAELTIGDLYTGPTIAQLADRIGQPAVGPTDQSADDRKERLRKRREHQQRRREVRSK